MSRYRKILVAFDGSESSTNALRQGFSLAVEEKSWITVATVVPSYDGDLDLIALGDIYAHSRRQGEEILTKAVAIAKKNGALIKTVLEEGDIYSRLLDLAESENSGLIIMGRRGTSKTGQLLVGSATARVIGHSHRDVLVVPEGMTVGWKRILVATDGSRFSSLAVEKAIDFAEAYGGTILAVSVVDVPAEFYAEAPDAIDSLIRRARRFVAVVEGQAKEKNIVVSTSVGEGDAPSFITKISREEQIDVIIMGSHGRTGLARVLMGSVTEKVIGYASCPVLVVKGNDGSSIA
jgi:nucleotide-binding universal stress UspA family protein